MEEDESTDCVTDGVVLVVGVLRYLYGSGVWTEKPRTVPVACTRERERERRRGKLTDTHAHTDWHRRGMASAEAIKRITNDLEQIFEEEELLAFVFPDEEDITKMQCIIVGPEGTPYEGGFFLFGVYVCVYVFLPVVLSIVCPSSSVSGCGHT